MLEKAPNFGPWRDVFFVILNAETRFHQRSISLNKTSTPTTFSISVYFNMSIECVVASDGTIIGIRFIESIKFRKEPDEKIIEILKGDKTAEVTTVSGKMFLISMKYQKVAMANRYSLPDSEAEIEQIFFDSWIKYQTT